MREQSGSFFSPLITDYSDKKASQTSIELNVSLDGTGTIPRPHLQAADFSAATFHGQICGVRFSDCDFRGADFSACDLVDVEFTRCSIARVIWPTNRHCNIRSHNCIEEFYSTYWTDFL